MTHKNLPKISQVIFKALSFTKVSEVEFSNVFFSEKFHKLIYKSSIKLSSS